MRLAPSLLPAIRGAYAKASMALKLPMARGFDSWANVKDIPFIARHATRTRAEVCKLLKIPTDKPIILASFGGYGLPSLDTTSLSKFKKYTVLMTQNVPLSRAARKEVQAAERKGSFVSINEEAMYDVGVRYEDLVGAAEALVTKPGYGVISECIANDAAVLYTSRGHFPEYDVLVEEMPKYVRSAFISHDDLFDGKWETAPRQAAQPGEAEEEARDQRRRRRGRDPAEGARQAAEEAARPSEGEVLGGRLRRTFAQPALRSAAIRIRNSSGRPMPKWNPSAMAIPQNFQARPTLGRIIQPSTTDWPSVCTRRPATSCACSVIPARISIPTTGPAAYCVVRVEYERGNAGATREGESRKAVLDLAHHARESDATEIHEFDAAAERLARREQRARRGRAHPRRSAK